MYLMSGLDQRVPDYMGAGRHLEYLGYADVEKKNTGEGM